jgi:Peptidase family M28
MRVFCLLGLAVVASGCAGGPTPAATGAVRPAAWRAPTEDELRRDLTVFASDSFRGREAGTVDERRAAAFLAARLAALGVRPAGDSGYYQRVPLVRETLGAATRLAVITRVGTTTFAAGPELIPLLDLGAGVIPPKRSADGALAFVGHGSAEQLARVVVRGKIIVVVAETRAAISDQVQRILALKPAGVIVMLTGPAAAVYQEMEGDMARALVPSGPSQQVVPDGERSVPMILLGRPHAGSPLLPAAWPKDTKAQILPWRRFSGRIDIVRQPVMAYNVMGIVPGHDSTVAREYVAFGAHYDHLGIVSAEHGDSIANGADDDGSGSVALLALARAFVQSPPPRRSVLLVWHTAEEKGLLGSAYFTDHATVPLDSVIAQVNADMIGRNNPDSLYVVGPVAAPNGQGRALGLVVDSVNAALAHPFVLDRAWDSPTHPEQIYYRSDHYNYARKGVPIVFFTTGLHADYHRVTDEVGKIDFAKLTHVDLLLFDLGEALADRNGTPRGAVLSAGR